MERDEEHFDLDDEFVAGAEEENYDRFIDRVDRRKQAAAVKKGKAAWSKLEEVLADRIEEILTGWSVPLDEVP